MKTSTQFPVHFHEDGNTDASCCNCENAGNHSLIKALKAVIYPWMKEAAAEAYREQAMQEQPRYPERVTVTQASEITGYSVYSLYQLHSRGQIPGALKVGGKLLFHVETLRKWVESGGRIV